MKTQILFAFIILISALGTAQQVAVNTTGASGHPSAILDIASNSKGVLVPRMTTPDRESILTPAQGLLVFDLDTRSFWFFDGQWKEISSNGSTGNTAGGDLTGQYPSPTVAKIQGHNVDALTPADKQALKWDQPNNMWRGMNDSLFLPYTATVSEPNDVFSIKNTYNGFSLPTVIHAERLLPSGIAQTSATAVWGDAFIGTGVLGTSSYHPGVSGSSIQSHGVMGSTSANSGQAGVYGLHGTSGINPGVSMGVWGNNNDGMGTVGTSNLGNGVFGSSITNHGIAGYSGATDFAGVYGSNQEYGGIGVMGDVEEPGIAILGQTTGAQGNAGIFRSLQSTHFDTTLITYSDGVGPLATFNLSNPANSNPAVNVYSAGNGTAVYSNSAGGTSAKFENTNSGNNNSTLIVSNMGTGPALNVQSTKGKAGVLSIIDAAATNETLNVNTIASRRNAVFTSDHPTTIESNLFVENEGLGRGIEVQLYNASNTRAGIFVNTFGNKGIEVNSGGTIGITSKVISSNGIAVTGTAPSSANNAIGVKGMTGVDASNGIGVLGEAGANDVNGIGVKGIAGGGLNGGIGVFGEGKASNPNAIGVKGVSYTHNEDVGAVTGINMTDGVGVYGEALGFDGIGVAGTVGNTSNHSVAAVFTNTYSENNRAVMELISNGKGNGILLMNTSLTNTSPLLRITNSGNGQFLRFENGLGSIKTSLSKEGNFTTAGTVTVQGDKGIVRNSTSTQLRIQTLQVIVPAGSLGHYDEFNGSVNVDVTFTTPFSAPPSVYIADLVTGSLQGLTVRIQNVTVNGFTLKVLNYTPYDFNYVSTTYKIVAMGAE